MSIANEIVHTVNHGVATVTLNRPQALNSLNTYMVQTLRDLLRTFSTTANCVVVKGAGGKAFCAGGDVKAAVVAAQTGHTPGEPMTFFRTEYALDLDIAQLPIPYIALADGIVMGGGAGVAMNGAFRVVTERSVFAMPEMTIGLFPDVGASYFLQRRLPGHLGLYLALTATRLKGQEIRDLGLATHFIPSPRLAEVEERLGELGPTARDFGAVNELLCEVEAFSGVSRSSQGGASASNTGLVMPPEAGRPAGSRGLDRQDGGISGAGGSSTPSGESSNSSSSQIAQRLPLINRHFGLGSVAEIVQSLQATENDAGDVGAFATETLEALSRGSPLSQLVTFEQLRRAKHMSLAQCLELDTHLVQEFASDRGDWFEGVRALLIDKGGKPRWKYADHHQVPEQVVQAFFTAHSPSALSGDKAKSKL